MDDNTMEKSIWKRVEKYDVSGRTYTTALDVLHDMSLHGFVKITPERPELSYFENSMLDKEALREFLTKGLRMDLENPGDVGIFFGDGPRIGEYTIDLVTPRDVARAPRNLALVVSGIRAVWYEFRESGFAMFVDDYSSNPSAYVPFKSIRHFTQEAAQEWATSRLEDAGSRWPWRHGAKATCEEGIFSIAGRTFLADSEPLHVRFAQAREERLLELEGKLARVQSRNPAAAASIRGRIETLRVEPLPDAYTPFIRYV